jgi:hypothetical protein
VSIPAVSASCWPVDWSCLSDEEQAAMDADVMARAEALATTALRRLTGNMLGACPVVIRPCTLSCYHSQVADGSWMSPYINTSGRWVNACGCNDGCSCTTLSEVIMPEPVGRIDLVMVDGLTLPSTAYKVQNDNRLLRIDGGVWPTCQDMTLDPTDLGTFAVTYTPGAIVDGLASFMAGLLAKEFAYACMGKSCALPTTVTSIVRQGVSIELATGAFPGNRTGILPIDAWLSVWNPYAVTTPAAVFSPKPKARRTTWAPS